MSYEFSEVLKHLPHRFPFLFVDKIMSVELGDSIHAQKNVSFNEDFFNGHFPNKPVMPGVLIIEALAQAAGILGFMTMGKTPEEGSIYYFAGVDNVRFKKPVMPGDRLDMEARYLTDKRGVWRFTCEAKVEGQLVCHADVMCAEREKQN